MASDDGRWGSFPSTSERTERCIFGKEEVKLPHSLIEQNNIFKAVLSKETFDNLSETHKKHLMKFLPAFPENDEKEKAETLRRLFAGENFNFGNPLAKFMTQLRDGYYATDITRYTKQCKHLKQKDYKSEMQRYFHKLVPEILLARHKVFEELGQVPPDPQVPIHLPTPLPHQRSLEPSVRRKYYRILNEVREECEVMETSSEEEEEAVSTVQKSRRQLFKSLGPIPSPEPTVPAVLATHAARPPTINGDVSGDASMQTKRQRPISPVEVTDDDYRVLLRNHKRKKYDMPELPELDTQNITLQDILARCQANKKITKSPSAAPAPTPPSATQTAPTAKRKGRGREREGRRVRRKVKEESMETSVSDSQPPLSPALGASAASLEGPGGLLHREDVTVPDFPLPEHLPSRLTLGQASSFFSLLRDIISEFPDSKVTTPKLEERVREWQESPSSALNAWFPSSPSWVDSLSSALRFLAGDLAGVAVENFAPYLDYKERAQQWRWIGPRRDGDAQLTSLFLRWLQCKEQAPTECLDSNQGSPPPPRVKTSYVVQPTSNDEKRIFQDQEWRRFETPHKAFTYRLHGYESVVGPVKGVYSKDSAMTKAREHALLISERPSYVTILTLVRDAAARLPNGEGTRGDICELLKDSQFLSTCVTDAQVNTVVSGALDRLHSEKDPCVKYDVNRKLWIYLHRNRTEEEFERIHQAQAAAVKAKKSLQKPKASKTIKETISSQTSARQSLSLNVSNSSDVSVDGSLSPAQPSPTPTAASTSPRGATTKHVPAKASAPGVGGEAVTVSAALASLRNSQLLQGASPKTSAPATIRLPGVTLAHGVVKEGAGRGAALQARVTPRQGSVALAQAAAQAVQQGAGGAGGRPQGSPSTAHASGTVSAAAIAGTGAKLVTLSQAPAPQGAPTTTLVTAPARGGEGPMVARLMGGQKVMSVGNLLASGVQRLPTAQTMTIKIQDGSIVHPVGGGKPIALGGKPRGQVGVLQAGQGPLSTISIFPHSSQGAISLAQTKLLSSTANTVAGTLTAKTVASSLGSGGAKVPVASLVAATGKGGQPSLVGPQTIQLSGPRVVSPAQPGLVVTQLPGNISLARQGLAGAGQAKVVTGSQASLVPAQFIVQQAPGTVKPLGKDASQGLATTQLVVSSAAGKSPNIQVVRTVLSQGGGLKPGQATILISQPGLQAQPPGTVLSSQVLPAASQGKSSGRGSPRGKPQPVYARIITPPPGMKLAAVGGGQAGGGGTSVGVLTTVNKLLSSAAAASSSGAVTVTLPAGALQGTVVSPVVTAALATSAPTPAAATPKPAETSTDS